MLSFWIIYELTSEEAKPFIRSSTKFNANSNSVVPVDYALGDGMRIEYADRLLSNAYMEFMLPLLRLCEVETLC